jgi:hypothetical protein
MLALLRLPFARIVRRPRGWLPVAGWGVLALLAAWVAREQGGGGLTDPLLLGPFAGVALPFLALGIVSAACGGGDLRTAARPLVSFGASPWRAAVACLVPAVVVSAVLGAALGAAVPAIAYHAGSPPLVRDVITTAWVAALGGASYAAYFAFGSTFGARGVGRGTLLVLDFFLGSGAGTGAVLTPRGHVRSLLGGIPPLELSQRGSAWILVVLLVVYGGLAVARARLERR